ncbi:MAG: TonB-dependent receptor [Pirellulaceae bacterium]|nr:TonB-dependent receptor [Pirellulaceae bacterium]
MNVFGRIEGYDSSLQVWHRASERSSAEGGYANVGLGYLPEAQWGDSSTAVEAANTWKLNKHKSFQTLFTFNDYQIDRDSRYVFPSSGTEWFLDDFKWGRGWSLELEEIYRYQPSKDFSLLAGGVMRYSDVIPKATFIGGYDPRIDPVAQSGFFDYTDGSGDPQSIPQVSQVKFWTFAAYLESQYQIFDKLRLVGGVRVTTDERYDQTPVTPRFSAIYSMTERFTTKYMYTQAFVAPAPYFAFATYDNGALLATTNPDVNPETAETHELNFTYYGDDISLGLSAYYGTQADLILVSDQAAPQNIVEDPVTVSSGTRTLVQTANGGDSRRYGVDVYGKIKTNYTSSWISYSYVDFEQTNQDLVTGLPFISRHNGRCGITWQATRDLFITPSVVIRSTPENVAPGSLGKELHDPYEFNLYALYQRNNNLDLFLDLRNITDHHYALGGFTGDAYAQETFSGVVGMRLTY